MATKTDKKTTQDVDLTDPHEVAKAKAILNPLNSREEMRAWFNVYFDLDFPAGVIYPTSTHGPLDAMWEIYRLFMTGESAEVSQIVMLASRDSFKTLAASALEVIVLLHCQFSVAHGSAIKSQSLKAVQYVNTFFRKINKYLVYNGWEKISDSKTRIEWVTDKQESIYITVLVATLAGMNSEHVPLLCVSKKSKIHIALPDGRRKKLEAEKAFKLFQKDKEIKFASFNHDTNKVEYQPLLTANKTESSRITIKTVYTPKDPVNEFVHNEINVGLKHPVYVIGRGYIQAKSLKVGDKLLVFNNLRLGKVVSTSLPKMKKVAYVEPVEPFNCKICNKLVKKTYRAKGNVSCGRPLCTLAVTQKIFYTTVTEVVKHKESEEMYDFTVFKNHNFICDSILVKNCLDEIDLIQDPRVLDEATMIPCTYGRFFPLTVYLSTRKFAGGLMEKTMKNVENSGGKILRWNILDVTERIPHDIARVDEPKVLRYLSVNLPLQNISPEEWIKLPDNEKDKFERFEAYAGIAEHPLLSAMRNYLVDRDQDDEGGLYKSVISVRNNFIKTPPDMGEAQLLCNAPSTSNLVYGRFSQELNAMSVAEVYELIMGDVPDVVNFDLLLFEIRNLGLPIYGGADWGFTDYTVFVVFTVLPDGKVVLLWHERQRDMELEDIVEKAIEIEVMFGDIIWYPDQNYPAYLKTLRRKTKSKWKKFTKDVTAGISALQSKIVDASNRRNFIVVDIPETKVVQEAFGDYKWAKDGKGNIIDGVPYHDEDGVSDTMDAIRYPMQNLFGSNKRKAYGAVGSNTTVGGDANREIMRRKIQELTGEIAVGEDMKSVKKIIIT